MTNRHGSSGRPQHYGAPGSRTASWLWERAAASRSRIGIFVLGLLALAWVALRTGPKPSRLTYPCQQSALGLAVAGLGVPFVMVVLAARAGLLRFLRSEGGKFAGGLLATLVIVLLAIASTEPAPNTAAVALPENYSPQVFLVNDARGIEPGRYGGVDDLVTTMGVNGLEWHRSATSGITSGPDGLIDRDDVVLLKINAQWAERGGTNTDVLRGVIRRIVEHPDGFVGEIVVADNGQGSGNLNRTQNNAEDIGQSPQDVVDDFATEGWTISARLWDNLCSIGVNEYSTGDMQNGYVVNPVRDLETLILVSYPKFQTAFGTYISYKHGIWSPEESSYDPGKLVVINMPVLKTHSIYGVTSSVKNHMGVVTRLQSTDAHNCVANGGMGSVLAEVRLPDLTILDCVWILARPGSGPSATYANASRRDQLVAGTDPVALDMWATKYILMPQIIANGYTYANYGSTQDPDNPNSKFRRYLDYSMNELLRAGITTTNDYDTVDLRAWAADADRDGDLDATDWGPFADCLTGPDVALEPACEGSDFDLNGSLDLRDVARLQTSFTGSE